MAGTQWWKPCVAEFLGVFALVFLGAGTIITLSHMGLGTNANPAAFIVAVALAHGLALVVMITAFGPQSGGHFNPAVTIAVLFTRRIKLELGLLYIIFQLLGGIFGAFLLVSAFPSDWWQPVNLGAPALLETATGLPIIDAAKGVLIEAVLTFFLVLVVFAVGVDQNNPMKALAGVAIGLTVAADILVGGFLTGAAMNPARAFGPALLARHWEHQFVYWAGPILGGIIAGLAYDSAYFPPRARTAGEAKAAEPAQSS